MKLEIHLRKDNTIWIVEDPHGPNRRTVFDSDDPEVWPMSTADAERLERGWDFAALAQEPAHAKA